MNARIPVFQTLVLWLLIAGTPALIIRTAHAQEPAPDPDNAYAYTTLDSLFNQYQPYIDNISAYEPVYFLRGVNPEKSKFQISMKYRFINPSMALSQKYPWSRGFFFAYTQTSFWDLKSDSRPFDDTSYKPEAFFRSPNLFSGKGLNHLFLQTGYQHISNGKDDELSRSTNIIYIHPTFIFMHQKSGYGLMVSPKVWIDTNNNKYDNPDLFDYWGYFDLGVKFGKADGAVFETHWRKASKGDSFTADLTFPLDGLFPTHLQLYLHAQYTESLAESLLHYQTRTHAMRLGFSIVR